MGKIHRPLDQRGTHHGGSPAGGAALRRSRRHGGGAALTQEAAAVARAAGAKVPDDIVERTMTILQRIPAGMYASMYHDYAKGGPIEIEGMSAMSSTKDGGSACQRRTTPRSMRY